MRTQALHWLAIAALAAGACGGGAGGGAPATGAADSAASAAADSSVVPPDSTAALADSTAALEDSVGTADEVAGQSAARSAIGFSHARHSGLDCRRCHAEVAGHASHQGTACTDCHAPPAATAAAEGPTDCGSCHHAATRGRSCTACHQPERRGAIPLSVSLKLSVWSAPRSRELTFDHARHSTLQCRTCHTDAPAFAARPDCGACHAHHAGGADCRVCHPSPPAGAHTAAVHSGCAGGGCHQDPPVRVATLSRSECLLCHPDRVQHEPGRACASCHIPEGEGGER